MKYLKRFLESVDKLESIEDYLLELTESEFLKLESKPHLVNEYGESGNDFNPVILVNYSLNYETFVDIEELERFHVNLKTLINAIKRTEHPFKFNLSDGRLRLYFDIPDNMNGLFDKMDADKKIEYKIENYRKFVTINVGGRDVKLNTLEGYPFSCYFQYVALEFKFNIDEEFNIIADVKGLSWGDIGELNKSEQLVKDLIGWLEGEYSFKFTNKWEEERSLKPHGKVVHWYFKCN